MRKLTRRGLLGRLMGLPAAVAVGVLGLKAAQAPAVAREFEISVWSSDAVDSDWFNPKNWVLGKVPQYWDRVIFWKPPIRLEVPENIYVSELCVSGCRYDIRIDTTRVGQLTLYKWQPTWHHY